MTCRTSEGPLQQALQLAWIRAVLLCAGAMLLAVIQALSPSAADAQTPPAPPPKGDLGGLGPCKAPTNLDQRELGGAASKRINAWNASVGLPERHVWVYEPSGTDLTPRPRTGGKCNDQKRPVALVVHGYPAQEIVWSGPAEPWFYGSLIQNLVSNGYIVVFANWHADWGVIFGDLSGFYWSMWTVWVGMLQAVAGISDGPGGLLDQTRMTSRADLHRIGMFGHSLGGGMVPYLANTASSQPIPGTTGKWGDQALWAAMYASTDGWYHCNIDDDDGDGAPFDEDETDVDLDAPSQPQPPEVCNPTRHPVQMPAHARVLFVAFDNDELGWPLGGGIHYESEQLYEDMTPVASKWAIVVRSDCSHSGSGEYPCGVDGKPMPTHWATHLTPNDPIPPTYFKTPRDHIKWYGVNRNVQAVAECAMPGDQPPAGDDCNINLLLPMGTWSGEGPATPAVIYPTSP